MTTTEPITSQDLFRSYEADRRSVMLDWICGLNDEAIQDQLEELLRRYADVAEHTLSHDELCYWKNASMPTPTPLWSSPLSGPDYLTMTVMAGLAAFALFTLSRQDGKPFGISVILAAIVGLCIHAIIKIHRKEWY